MAVEGSAPSPITVLPASGGVSGPTGVRGIEATMAPGFP